MQLEIKEILKEKKQSKELNFSEINNKPIKIKKININLENNSCEDDEYDEIIAKNIKGERKIKNLNVKKIQ